jgi:hypothetical protein
MSRSSTTSLLVVLCVAASSAFAQGTSTAASQAAQNLAVDPDRPVGPVSPPLFREDWTPPNPNLELKVYGPSSKQMQLPGQGGQPQDNQNRAADPGRIPGNGGRMPPHLWTGMCEQVCAAAIRDKNNYLDLSGLAKIRWFDRVSGMHHIHPMVKLADGTWLVSEHEDGSEFDYHLSEFTLSEFRWIRLNIDRVVTHGRWLSQSEVDADLAKVDEVGFTDLMPGSGHGNGGWMDMSWIEVYGKAVPRTSH